MKDQDKTKEQFIAELVELRKQNVELEKSETDHKKAEDKLQKANDELKNLLEKQEKSAREWQETFDASLDIIALISPDFKFLKVNRTGYETIGKKPEELIGEKCYEVIHGLDSPIDGCPCAKTLETKTAGSGEITQQGRHYIATASPILDKNNELIAFVHTIKDITKRKKAEDALQKAHEVLERRVEERTAELVIANKQLKREIEERRQTEEALKESESKLRKQRSALEQKNIALREIIEQIEIEKRRIKEDMITNVEMIVFPILERLKEEKATIKSVNLLQHHLEGLTSSFGHRITEKSFNLTPREIEVCNMVKAGLTSKDISNLLNISYQTVEGHRKNVRHKLGIANKDINLNSFLRGL